MRPNMRGTLLPARWCRILPFVFFFFFATTRTDSRQRGSDSGRFTLIRADSGRIGHIGETAETHRASTEQENENKQKMDKNLWLTVSWASEDGEEIG